MGALTPGTVLGGCRIDAVVGRGGMGIVYRARQLDLDRDVAVKVIAPELLEDSKSRKRFLTEARAAGAIEHPNVGRARDVPCARHAAVPLRPGQGSAVRDAGAVRPRVALLHPRARREARDARHDAARLAVRGPRGAGRIVERDRQPGRLRATREENPRREIVFSLDNWDGYVPDRQLVLDILAEHQLRNTVVMTGDSHEHPVRNVPPDFRSLDGTPVATEFMGTSLTSEGHTGFNTRFGGTADNPHELFDDHHRGYVKVTLDSALWSGEFRGLDDVRKPDAVTSSLATFVVENGKPGALRLDV